MENTKIKVDVRTLDRMPNFLFLTFDDGRSRIVTVDQFVAMVVEGRVKS